MKIGDTLNADEVKALELFPTSRKHTFKRATKTFGSGSIGIVEVEFDPYTGSYTVVDQYIKQPCEISQRLFEEAVTKSSSVSYGIAAKIVKACSVKSAKPRGVKNASVHC